MGNRQFFYLIAKYSSIPFVVILVVLFLVYINQNHKSNKVTTNPPTSIYRNGNLYVDKNTDGNVITKTEAFDLRSTESSKVMQINGINISLMEASTQKQQNAGLMYLKTMPTAQGSGSLGSRSKGMIFYFKNYKIHPFWMANTLIPLDMLFISNNLTINQIIKAQPCTGIYCKILYPKYNSKYVIEVTPKFVNTYNIKIGENISL